MAESTTPPSPPADAPAHVALATVFQVRAGALCVLLWERAREPFSGAWALPFGVTLVAMFALQLSNLGFSPLLPSIQHEFGMSYTQLGLFTGIYPLRHPERWELATAYLGLVPLGLDPRVPADTAWHSVDALPQTAFDHGTIVLAGRDRLRGKLSYTNIGFALAPEAFTLAELRDIYVAALGYEVSSTNLKRVLVRRGAIEAVGRRRAHGPAGGRPAELYRFRDRKLAVTDPFAVLRPPA